MSSRPELPMKRFLPALTLLLLLATRSSAQWSTHQYTKAQPPSAEALDRLSLKMAWYKKVAMMGIKDGIADFQLMPGDQGEEILIQTMSGQVEVRDAETGDLRWRSPVGTPFKYIQGAAFNSHSIYVTREARLFALDRATGKHRIYLIEAHTGFPQRGVPILNAPSTTMIASEALLYVPSDTRITGYVPPVATKEQVTLSPPIPGQVEVFKGLPSSPQPKFLGTYILLAGNVTRPPVLHGEAMGLLTNDGTFVSLNKFKLTENFHFKTYGVALAGVGNYRNMAYVGSSDFNVYALNMGSGKLLWRFLSGSPIVRTPQATDKDVFVVSENVGLCRVDRDDGKLVWKNIKAVDFLATNGKFVYALDQLRYLLVIDYLKGTTLSRYDLSDYLVHYRNTTTDRIYLTNHDGSILCLRHQNLKKPYRPVTPEE